MRPEMVQATLLAALLVERASLQGLVGGFHVAFDHAVYEVLGLMEDRFLASLRGRVRWHEAAVVPPEGRTPERRCDGQEE
jgi:hypothetical protein